MTSLEFSGYRERYKERERERFWNVDWSFLAQGNRRSR